MAEEELTPVDVSGAQAAVDAWIKTIGVRYYNELTNLAILAEEVGEVARLAARRYGEQSFKSGNTPTESDLQNMWSDELADVLFVLLCLANQTGVDLTAALTKGLEKRTSRDSQRHQTNPLLRRRD